MPALVSVVTATFQNATALIGCLDSVAAQNNANVEHIVIDGGSHDETRALLEARQNSLAAWVSEPDSGISEAMNKGVALSSGEWLLFLHADDRLYSNSTMATVAPLLGASDADIVAFPILYGENPGRVLTPRGANHWLRLKTGFLHQGAFIRRRVFDQIGLHDTALKIAMDYDFFLRAWLAGVSFSTCDAPVVARMSDGGVSSQLDWSSLRRRLAEEKSVHFEHANSLWMCVGYRIFWAVYPPYKRLVAAFRTRTHSR